MPDHMSGEAWLCYRLVVDHICTWTEVTTTMSLCDVLDLCTADDAIYLARNPPQER